MAETVAFRTLSFQWWEMIFKQNKYRFNLAGHTKIQQLVQFKMREFQREI